MAKDAPKSSFGTLVIVLMIVLLVVAVRLGWLPWNNIQETTTSPIYDTDPANDRFIKGELTASQLKTLDKILNEEQKNNQQRLSNDIVKRLAKNDRAVMDAYARWRKCHDLMRSSYQVVYPNQRKYLKAEN